MKSLFLSIMLFLPVTSMAMQNLPTLVIKNNSEQTITVYYKNGITRYIAIKPRTVSDIKLQLPQNLTVHFNELDWQQNIVLDTHTPLRIHQYQNIIHANVIDVAQDKKPLFQVTYFN